MRTEAPTFRQISSFDVSFEEWNPLMRWRIPFWINHLRANSMRRGGLAVTTWSSARADNRSSAADAPGTSEVSSVLARS